jgi:hypothetical protein
MPSPKARGLGRTRNSTDHEARPGGALHHRVHREHCIIRSKENHHENRQLRGSARTRSDTTRSRARPIVQRGL